MTQSSTNAAASPKSTLKPGSKLSRRTLRKLGRQKRAEKIRTDQEFAKAYFGARSKRSADKKLAFRKRYAKKT